jgi:hypothetical protein
MAMDWVDQNDEIGGYQLEHQHPVEEHTAIKLRERVCVLILGLTCKISYF